MQFQTAAPVFCPGTDLTGRHFMHVLIAGLYACIIWLSVLAYCIILNGPVLVFLALSPVIISGAIAVIITLDFAVRGIGWTLRRWRPARAN